MQESCSPYPTPTTEHPQRRAPWGRAFAEHPGPGRGHPGVEGAQGQPRGRAGCGRGPCPRLGGAEHPLPALPDSSCSTFLLLFFFNYFFLPASWGGLSRPVPSRP